MDWKWYLYSFHGRVSRGYFWLFTFATMLIYFISGALATSSPPQFKRIIEMTPVLLLMWPVLAVQVKRWHDRNKSGWWVLVNLVPVVGQLWALIENGFLPGTRGSNRYGPDPLGDLDEYLRKPGER